MEKADYDVIVFRVQAYFLFALVKPDLKVGGNHKLYQYKESE